MDARANERARVGMFALGVVTLAALVASCASTQMTSTWTDPAAKGAALSKIAVVCVTKDAGLRRIAENTTASKLAGAQAIPSYQILGDTDLRDLDAVKSKLRAAGINGVLAMRMTGVSEQVTDVGGPYGTFDGYWGYAGGRGLRARIPSRGDGRPHGQQPLLAGAEQAALVGRQQDLRSRLGAGLHDRRLQGGREVAGEGTPDPLTTTQSTQENTIMAATKKPNILILWGDDIGIVELQLLQPRA